MSKHTPGPWRIEPHYKCGWKGTAKDPTPNRWQAIYVPGQERGAKGIVVNIGIKGGEVDDYWLSIKEADARLIEAAPDMLKALEACLELEQEKANRHGYSDCCCMSWSRSTESAYENGTCPHQMARAALAKAEGRS